MVVMIVLMMSDDCDIDHQTMFIAFTYNYHHHHHHHHHRYMSSYYILSSLPHRFEGWSTLMLTPGCYHETSDDDYDDSDDNDDDDYDSSDDDYYNECDNLQ